MPGLDKAILDTIEKTSLIARVGLDIRNDFILAPHYNAIFLNAADDLWDLTYSRLKSGTYSPELPLTISVPKERGFTRPGSILQPIDRLVYQALTDLILHTLENQLDRNRTFSSVSFDAKSTVSLFQSSGVSWINFQEKIEQICEDGKYILKADVANYFERLPQHHLINLIYSSGCPSEVIKLLEEIFLAYQQRNSSGIIQGVFPSEVFGNFYLSNLDAYFELENIPSARYMDDIFLQFDSLSDARRGLSKLIDKLRQDGLHLNEHKSGIKLAEDLIQEETIVDSLFREARQEIESEVNDKRFIELSDNYGFEITWEINEDFQEPCEEDLHLAAVTRLFKSIQDYPAYSDKIEKFCLPLLRSANSDIAVDAAIAGVVKRPHMTKFYTSYLTRFIAQSEEVSLRLSRVLDSGDLDLDYQIMYVLAALLGSASIEGRTVKTALNILRDPRVSQEARAIAAIFAAKFGTPQQRRAVRTQYEGEQSLYVRSAILYATRHFSSAERRTCIKAWGGHSDINAFIAKALKS